MEEQGDTALSGRVRQTPVSKELKPLKHNSTPQPNSHNGLVGPARPRPPQAAHAAPRHDCHDRSACPTLSVHDARSCASCRAKDAGFFYRARAALVPAVAPLGATLNKYGSDLMPSTETSLHHTTATRLNTSLDPKRRGLQHTIPGVENAACGMPKNEREPQICSPAYIVPQDPIRSFALCGSALVHDAGSFAGDRAKLACWGRW